MLDKVQKLNAIRKELEYIESMPQVFEWKNKYYVKGTDEYKQLIRGYRAEVKRILSAFIDESEEIHELVKDDLDEERQKVIKTLEGYTHDMALITEGMATDPVFKAQVIETVDKLISDEAFKTYFNEQLQKGRKIMVYKIVGPENTIYRLGWDE